jgi:hypothetical protein
MTHFFAICTRQSLSNVDNAVTTAVHAADALRLIEQDSAYDLVNCRI